MKKPVFDTGVRLAEDIMVSRARVPDQSSEDILDFVWKLAEAFGFRLGKSIEEILADIAEAPNHIHNPTERN
jgi:hypothetical protein